MPETAREAMLKTIEPLHDDDRWSEAKIPRRAHPIRKKLGVGVVNGIRILIRIRRGCGRRHLIDLHRQSGRSLSDFPAPVGLGAGLDYSLLRLPAYREGGSIAAACGPAWWGLVGLQLHWGARRGGGWRARRFQDIGLRRQTRRVLHQLPTAVRLLTRLARGLPRPPACCYLGSKIVAYGLRLLRQGGNLCAFGWILTGGAHQHRCQDRDLSRHPFRSVAPVRSNPCCRIVAEPDQELAEIAAL